MQVNPLYALAALLFIATGMPGSAKALPPLTENERVRAELVAGGVSYEIQKHCPSIDGRELRAFGRLNKLMAYARSLGYTDADFRKVHKDPAARALHKTLVTAYLKKNGVKEGDPQSYCRLGQAEMAQKTLSGWLLRPE
jgi:hypothetical protein